MTARVGAFGGAGGAVAPDRPRSPTRTTSRPPGLAIMTIRARGPPLPARKAQ